ncbi:MAG: GNAT family N-acetyltransferase [Rhizobacter sp.]|nr:GNAT family N-acetyltransferase [Rhizobacter sp.]
MQLPERIETGRLVLRRPTDADALAIFSAYTQDVLVSRFLVWRPHSAVAEAQAFIESCISAWEEASRLAYVLVEAGSSSAIGMLEARPDGLTVDLGYVLARAHWGKGYMPEAVAALAEAALDVGYYRVQAFCDVENRASQRTLEKAGFTREGRLERYMVHPNISPVPRACFMYARCR